MTEILTGGLISLSTSNGGKHASLDIKERMTTPPTYLTESELISKMEHNGIGTDASISTHIENVLKRNYVELISGRKLKPSRLGLVLAQGYHLIDDSLVLPRIRSDIEDQCVQIAKGLADRVRFLFLWNILSRNHTVQLIMFYIFQGCGGQKSN